MSSWPECVGKTVEEARATVTKEFPDVYIQVLGPVQFLSTHHV